MKRLVCGIDTGLREVTWVLLECETGRVPKYRSSWQNVYKGPLETKLQCLIAYDWQMGQFALDAGCAIAEEAWYAVERFAWQGGQRALGSKHVGPLIARMGGAMENRLYCSQGGHWAMAVSREEAMKLLGCGTTKELNAMLRIRLGELPTEHHNSAAAVAWAAFIKMRA